MYYIDFFLQFWQDLAFCLFSRFYVISVNVNLQTNKQAKKERQKERQKERKKKRKKNKYKSADRFLKTPFS